MSDLMRSIPYRDLLKWSVREYREKGSIFGVSKVVRRQGAGFPIFDGSIETVFGPAAGPNTQLAQNIAASYAAGASWFELKTVQKMDGRELAACVPKPCIWTKDEGYNCEWSTELEVPRAMEEYIKAWFLIHVLAKEFSLGDPDAVVFNLSVGYDLEGIKTPKIDAFIEGMKDASGTEAFCSCMEETLFALREGLLANISEEDVKGISPKISDSVTESTLHGCPPDEIERIASYLITEKHLNCYVKCNPTLLGYAFARKTLDELGYDYIAFDDHHFLEDLQWADAVPMLRRLKELAESKGLSFGVKLTNTFPVDVKAGELPSEEMYMSGRSLFPLTMELVSRIAKEFDGKLRISFSGGADYFSIKKLVSAGVWPVTMATTLLKPGGYQRMSQIADLLSDIPARAWDGINVTEAAAIASAARTDPRYRKMIKPLPDRKMEEELPLMDCFSSPCQSGCPISQDIPAYLRAMEEGRAEDALSIILERNALPFITGTICPHTCAERCMRNHYEESIRIREVKLKAAREGAEKVLARAAASLSSGVADAVPGGGKASARRVAVVGGGPAGLSCASFLSRAGIPVTVFEKQEELGGVVRSVIPGFRIDGSTIDRDIELCSRFGAEFVTEREITDLDALKAEGFTDVIVAVGAWKSGPNPLRAGTAVDALEFLKSLKEDSPVEVGEEVIVIGGGNTAMDAARAAIRLPGVKKVRLVYRRTRRYMPADEEELDLALKDGVEFCELLAPLCFDGKTLECARMRLGKPDASGRRSPEETGETIALSADLVIAAVGERVDTALLEKAGAALDEKGRPVTDEHLQTSVKGIYAAGDCRRGPATVVKAIADAQTIASAIAGASFDACQDLNGSGDAALYRGRKGDLEAAIEGEENRCLGCESVCEVCCDVCPNRANVSIQVPGLDKAQVLHLDGMCNECGNCACFCPWSGRPYRDKLTLYWSEEDFNDSENTGFLVLEGTKVKLRFAGKVQEADVSDKGCGLYEPLRLFILTVITDYPWLLTE